MIPITYVFILAAVGVAIAAEVMVAYQKYQMKKQFVEELEKQERDSRASQG